MADVAVTYRSALGLKDPTQRSQAVADLLYHSIALAPQATMELALAAPLGELREVTLQTLAVQWGRDDRSAVFAWAMTQPATPSRDGIFQRLAAAYAQADPAGVAHLIAFGISPGEAQTQALLRVLEQWPEDTLTQAAEWVEQLPTEALRRRAEEKLRTLLSPGQ